jgi:menaquinone-9 beta-reductase
MPDAAVYDVAVVGASLAGCSTARLFAQQGLSVALIEQHAAVDWHKRLCTHYIQACAVPTIERLGLAPLIERAGGVRSRMEIWTRWGWIRHASRTPPETYGYSIRRKTLDPLMRQLAADTPGVTMVLGSTACGLLRDGDRVSGVTLCNPAGTQHEVRARLVVAADGRNSPISDLAGVPLVSKPNNRFAYFAYYRNLPLASGQDSQFWLLDPDAGYALPNEDGITLMCCWLTKDKLEAFRADREASFERFFAALPSAPKPSSGERISELMGALDLPIELRGGTACGLALVGDAALAADPLWGVGCGWAFQSAEWLVDSTAATLHTDGDIAGALRHYHRQHRWALVGHYGIITDYARGRRFRALEKLYYGAAARDPEMADIILAFGARRVGVRRLLAPSTLARAAWSRLRRAGA